jgi:hypothetical protein
MLPFAWAIETASQTILARMWVSIDQPTTSRVQQSMTVARYNQPVQMRK